MPGLIRQIAVAVIGVALAVLSADVVRTLLVCNVRNGTASAREVVHSLAFVPRSAVITLVLPSATRDATLEIFGIAVVLLVVAWRTMNLQLRFLDSLRGIAIAVIAFAAAGAICGFAYDSTLPIAYDC